MNALIYTQPDGSVGRIGLKSGQAVESLLRFIPPGAEYVVLDDRLLPDDSTRAAWVLRDGQVVVGDEKPLPVPQDIEFRQLIIGAMLEGWITPAEAEAWAKGNELPEIVHETIAQLPAQQQAIARITALTRDKIKRSDALIGAAAAVRMPDATPEERTAEGDRLFREWSKL